MSILGEPWEQGSIPLGGMYKKPFLYSSLDVDVNSFKIKLEVSTLHFSLFSLRYAGARDQTK